MKLLKFLLLSIPVLGLGMFMGYRQHMAPEKFSIEGIVTEINWQSRNHGMPVIKIKPDIGSVKTFSSNRITLTAEQLKVGDTFVKNKNSKICEINGQALSCIN